MRSTVTAFTWTLLFVIAACAREPSAQRHDGAVSADVDTVEQVHDLQQWLYPPDLIMDHQARIELNSEQRKAILDDVEAVHAQQLEVDADLRRHREALASAVSSEVVDEVSAVQLAQRVMESENRLRTAQLQMLIRIRGRLTAQQRDILDDVR